MAALVVMAMASGCSFIAVRGSASRCTTSYAAPVVDTVVAGAGIALAATAGLANGHYDQLENQIAGVLLLASTPYVISAIYGYTTVAGCRAPKPREDVAEQQRIADAMQRTDRLNQERRQARERAWMLTKTAALAARGGDCASVEHLGPQVLALDPEFHATVFMSDLAIKRCLDADVPAPVTTPAPIGSTP